LKKFRASLRREDIWRMRTMARGAKMGREKERLWG
jgi:hypothetical protein